MPSYVIPIGAAVGAILLFVLVFRAVWRVAEPNEALIISGLGAKGDNGTDLDTLSFKIVVGRGTAVIPGFQTVRRLGLGIRSTPLQTDAVSNQSIPVSARGNVAWKVGDDLASIANAARRFLEQDETAIQSTIHDLFSGHLRAIIGGLSVEDMLHNREQLTRSVRESLATDLAKLGLVVDSLQMAEITDKQGYIENLGKPKAAEIAAAARIAAAQRDQQATRAEQESEALKAESVRESRIKQAGYQAEVDRAKAESDQAGPLAEARARQEVVRAETVAAELDAQREEKVLETTVKKPADAKAYERVTLAEAERTAAIKKAQAEAEEVTLRGNAQAQATEVTGLAEAKAIEARGLAEAAGIDARAKALATNKDGVIEQMIADKLPEIVRANAEAFASIDNLTVLNGAQGMGEMMGGALTAGGAVFGMAKDLVAAIGSGTLGTTPAVESAPAAGAQTVSID
jgi:flotillin